MYTRAMLSAAVLVALAFIIAGCGEDPVQPNQAPVITNWVLEQDGFSSATLTADIHDPDGEVVSIDLDWGDGKQEDVAVTPSIDCEHAFADKFRSYTVSLKVSDNDGGSIQETKSLEITVPKERCIGFKGVVNFCVQFDNDPFVVRIWGEALGERLELCSLGTGNNTCTLNDYPLVTQRTKFKWEPETHSIRLSVEQNTFLWGWEELWSHRFDY